MHATHTKIRVAIVSSTAIAVLGVTSVSHARPIGDPPDGGKRTQPIKARSAAKSASRRFDGGFGRYSGLHVYSAGEARTE
jgi:hypothetical protein